ncbi:MAG: hypothetical protein WC517_01780 [Patescibacteria group bacterium]
MNESTLALIRELLAQRLEVPLEQITDETKIPDLDGLNIVVRFRTGHYFKVPSDESYLTSPITLGQLIALNSED